MRVYMTFLTLVLLIIGCRTNGNSDVSVSQTVSESAFKPEVLEKQGFDIIFKLTNRINQSDFVGIWVRNNLQFEGRFGKFSGEEFEWDKNISFEKQDQDIAPDTAKGFCDRHTPIIIGRGCVLFYKNPEGNVVGLWTSDGFSDPHRMKVLWSSEGVDK